MAFHRFLDEPGSYPMPVEHYYGWLSKEFGGRLPTELMREEMRLPFGFLLQLLEYRRYAEAKHANDVDEKNWQSTPMRRLAKEIQHALVHEAK